MVHCQTGKAQQIEQTYVSSRASGDTTEIYAPENEEGEGDKRWIAILKGLVKASLIEEVT